MHGSMLNYASARGEKRFEFSWDPSMRGCNFESTGLVLGEWCVVHQVSEFLRLCYLARAV